MRIVFIAFALGVAACGRGDTPAAQAPSATSESNTTLTGAAATTTPARNAPSDTASPATAGSVANHPGAADQNPHADNTQINDRDRQGTLTPVTQGNTHDELRITADIRKGIMAEKSLSFDAKNVKVITVGTKVTLRGPVKSDEEKSLIETRARQTPGVTDVDDQIEVKK